MLSFTLLGDFGVYIAGEPIAVPLRRSAVPLLAYVLLHGPAPLQRDRLAATLWPDEPESGGRSKLRRLLYVIGQTASAAGSPEWLRADTLTIAWNPEVRKNVDVERLGASPEAPGAAATPAAYGGELLAGFDDEWIVPYRDEFRERCVRRLASEAQNAAAAGRYAEALAAAEALLRIEPWREDIVRIAIEARLECGDRADALAELERFERRLAADFGITPMAETLELRRRISAAPVAEPRSAPREPAAGDAEAEAFVGRERELANLRDRLRDAERGRGGMVLMLGPAGIGKSALVARHARLAAARGVLAVTGGATFVSTRPYQPLAVAIALAARELPSDLLTEPMRLAFDRLVLGIGDEVGRNAKLEQQDLFKGVAAIFEALARRRPVLLVLEDLHWCGSETIAMLEFVVRHTRRLPVSVVATARDGDALRGHPLRAARRRLQDDELITTQTVGALGTRDVRRYLERRSVSLTGASVDRFVAASAGHPLILSSLVADVLEAEASGGVASSGHGAQAGIGSLQDRVASLPAGVRALLEVAAVAGFGFDPVLIEEVCGWSEAEAERVVADALDRRVIRARAGGFDLAHDLLREFVYDAMPIATRGRRHALVAAVLEDLPADSEIVKSSQLARHYELAGDRGRAIPALARAAAGSLAAFAHEDAAGYASRALDLGPDDRTSIDLILIREAADSFLGNRARRRADLERCTRLLEAFDLPEVEADICYRRLISKQQDAKLGEARDEAESLVAAAARAGGTWPARAAVASAMIAYNQERYPDARRDLIVAAEAYRAADDAAGIFETALMRVTVARMLADREEQSTQLALAESQLEALGNAPHCLLELYEYRGVVAIAAQRYSEAAEWKGRHLELAESIGDTVALMSGALYYGATSIRTHDFSLAARSLARCTQIAESVGDAHYAAHARFYGALLDEYVGRREASEAAVRLVLEDYREQHSRYDIAECTTALARLALSFGRVSEAESLAREGAALWSEVGYRPSRGLTLTYLGIALAQLDRPSESDVALREAIEIAEATGRPRDAAEAWCAAAVTAARAGRTADARVAIDRTRALLVEFSESNRALTLYGSLASALRSIGEERRAVELLREGARLLRQQAAAIGEAAWRESFLAKPEHRVLMLDIGGPGSSAAGTRARITRTPSA